MQQIGIEAKYIPKGCLPLSQTCLRSCELYFHTGHVLLFFVLECVRSFPKFDVAWGTIYVLSTIHIFQRPAGDHIFKCLFVKEHITEHTPAFHADNIFENTDETESQETFVVFNTEGIH
jgi:hypothetical protein